MPEKKTRDRARRDKAEGKAPSTQAGEFVREEIDHIREGKHGARSTKQAIAIGLSKARRAGVNLRPPATGKTSEVTRERAQRDYARSVRQSGVKERLFFADFIPQYAGDVADGNLQRLLGDGHVRHGP